MKQINYCKIEDGVLKSYVGNNRDVVVPYGVKAIGEGAFSRYKILRSIELPDSVTSIGGKAFAYCKNLKSISIPSSVTSIGKDAFFECDNLTNPPSEKN